MQWSLFRRGCPQCQPSPMGCRQMSAAAYVSSFIFFGLFHDLSLQVVFFPASCLASWCRFAVCQATPCEHSSSSFGCISFVGYWQGWTAPTKLTGLSPWSRHGQRLPPAFCSLSYYSVLLCQGLALAKFSIEGPFHGIPLANSKDLSSPGYQYHALASSN